MKNILKRVGAYLIDIIIVSVIAAVLSNISTLNPQLDSYIDVYDNYIEIQESYNNEEITEKQYEKELKKLNYQLQKNSVSSTIISIACLIAYFGIFQYSQNGKTIGKRIFKLQVVKNKEGNLNIGNYLLRCLILNNILFNIANIICVSILKQNNYLQVSSIITNSQLIVQIIIVLTMVMTNENRGLHDYIAGTKVIDLRDMTEDVDEEKKRSKIIDGEIIEKIKEPKESN